MEVLTTWDLLKDTLLVIILIMFPFVYGYFFNDGMTIRKHEKICFLFCWGFAGIYGVLRFIIVCGILK